MAAGVVEAGLDLGDSEVVGAWLGPGDEAEDGAEVEADEAWLLPGALDETEELELGLGLLGALL